ncbi:hypothetical protein FIBSPDRAFT_952402 [Athelia psychrophila]|uniref:Uncharacterized protein n=1 Tax=Athelia psychrophila TaxID=1759441 RepID=A0A166LLF3_9AGAM|nr:hypothetical protein FIBSPDRAFT_952402 [Fibularhizoctonia sp. CBS 109695]
MSGDLQQKPMRDTTVRPHNSAELLRLWRNTSSKWASSASPVASSATRPKHGVIKLAADDDDEHEHDPFNILTEDFIDGHPTEEEKFWAKARLRKLALSAALAFAVVADTVTYTRGPGPPCALCLIHAHSRRALHQPHAIGSQADALGSFRCSRSPSLLLSSPPLYCPPLLPLKLSRRYDSATLPHDPDLHYDLSNIYAPATFALASSSLGDREEGDVCGIATASALSYLTFSYTTRVVMLGHASSSLEIGDLHILPGDMRASTAGARMKHTS